MNWGDVWKIVLTAVASFGGAGAIITVVSKYLSDFLTEKMLKKYQSKLDKEIESYKHELEIEIEKMKAQNDKVNYVTQRQFDTEFAAYEKIFECMFKFSVYTRQLYPAFEWQITEKEKRKGVFTQRWDDYKEAFNTFSETIEINAPFIPEDIYEMLVKMRSLANEIATNYEYIRIEDREEDRAFNREEALKKYPKEDQLEEMVKQSKVKVRDYLGTLRIYE
ncbi:MAG: hypothetical protein IJU93_00625 [Lachnospiraceae bacterium]|nr:hypothetical protein [Lachnospiraceae bacterium]